MRRELSKLEMAGIQALDAQIQMAQRALSDALQELGFTSGAPVRQEGNVLTDEPPENETPPDA